MEHQDNSMCGIKVLLEQRGWGGNSNSAVRSEEEALGRLEGLVGNSLIKEMEAVYERNDHLLRAIHFQDRRLAVDFSELTDYLSPEEARSQIKEAYHRNNLLFDAYKQSVSDLEHFPELPKTKYAEERGWGGSPDLTVQSRENAESRLEKLGVADCVQEMNSLDERNNELCKLIHEKELGISKYLTSSVGNMNDAEIRVQTKHAYCRNNIFFDLFKATSNGEQFLSDFFVREILRNDGLSEEEILMQLAKK